MRNSVVAPQETGSSAQDGAGFDELNVSGNPNIGHFQKTIFRQIDTSKFSVPADERRGKFRASEPSEVPGSEQPGSVTGQNIQHLPETTFGIPRGCI